MRILIISTFFPPLNAIASLRPYSWAKYWTLAGHDVAILTMKHDSDAIAALALPNPGFRVHEVPLPAFVERLKKNYNDQGAVLLNQSQPKITLSSILKRPLVALFNYLRHRKGVFNACRMPDFTDLWIARAIRKIKPEGEWDLVVSSAGPYSVHIVAAHLKKKGLARRWIADYRDTWSNNYIFPGIFPFNIAERVLEKKLMHHADMITTVSDPFTRELAARYGSRVCTIENGFDAGDLECLPAETIFPDDGKYRIVHTGSIYLGKRDPTPLFQAIAELASDPKSCASLNNLEVLFAGVRQANLDELVTKYQVAPWVKMKGFVKREDALRMQRDAHRLLFLPWNDMSVDGVLTGKIYEYLFSGTPIIAVGAKTLEASQKLILDACAGDVFSDVSQIKQFLMEQLRSRKKTKSFPDKAVLEPFDRKRLAMKLLEKGASIWS